MNHISSEQFSVIYKIVDGLRNADSIADNGVGKFISEIEKIVDENSEIDYSLKSLCLAAVQTYLKEGLNCTGLKEKFLHTYHVIQEDAVPVNNVGDGKIAGTDNNPPVTQKNRKNIPLLRRKKGKNEQTSVSGSGHV